MNGLPLLPVVSVDVLGSAAAIILAGVALAYARALTRLQPNNFIWGFLFYLAIAMAAFSLSRGIGHLVRIVLVYNGGEAVWQRLAPFSGGFNTVLMITVAAITIYYYKGLAAYRAIGGEAKKLAEANAKLADSARELQDLNSNLEVIVEERTRNLSASEKKFRNLFENSKDIIFFADADGNINEINGSGICLLGLSAPMEEFTLARLLQSPEVLKAYLNQLHGQGFVGDFDLKWRGDDGVVRHILLSTSAVYDDNDRIVGYEGIGKDMTRLHTMTEQLINHEKMASIGQIAAGVAHEINTPLGIILGYAQLMQDDFPDNSEVGTNLQVIERQTKACRRIVSDLLKFSRQSESINSCLDLNALIEEVLAVAEHTLNINKIAVERNFAAEPPILVGDAEKLRQVFLNLFINSRDAMAEGGTLLIKTKRVGEEILVSVEDSGSGIAEESKGKIFDPFFTTKEVGKGTGLGLSVTYGIIQEHRGTIIVESPVAHRPVHQTSPGTAFHLRLPAIDNSAGRET